MRTTEFDSLRDRCLALIDHHYRDRRVGPAWLARELFVSRRQLDRAFAGGPSVAEALARRRVRQVIAFAAHSPTVPMSDIARSCGYGTYETFRAQCHKYLRCSPRHARDVHAMARRAARDQALAA